MFVYTTDGLQTTHGLRIVMSYFYFFFFLSLDTHIKNGDVDMSMSIRVWSGSQISTVKIIVKPYLDVIIVIVTFY